MPFELTAQEQVERRRVEEETRALEVKHALEIVISETGKETEQGVKALIEIVNQSYEAQLEADNKRLNVLYLSMQKAMEKQKKEIQIRIDDLKTTIGKIIKDRDDAIANLKSKIQKLKKQHRELNQQLDPNRIDKGIEELFQQNKKLLKILEPTKTKLEDVLIIKSAMSGDLQSVKDAIKHGADINAIDMQHETPLHKACAANNKEMAEYLLSLGCETAKKNIEGKTASQLTNDQTMNWLISKYETQLLSSKNSPTFTQTFFANQNPQEECKDENSCKAANAENKYSNT